MGWNESTAEKEIFFHVVNRIHPQALYLVPWALLEIIPEYSWLWTQKTKVKIRLILTYLYRIGRKDFWVIPIGAQGLFLTLNSRFFPGNAQKTTWGNKNQIWIAILTVNALFLTRSLLLPRTYSAGDHHGRKTVQREPPGS